MNRHAFRSRDYVEHMLDACERILEYTGGKTKTDFLDERFLQDAVVRNLEVLGEASRQLCSVFPDAPTRFPVIPFATMYAMRNRLTHGYIFINHSVIWEVVERDIPSLLTNLRATLASWPDDLT